MVWSMKTVGSRKALRMSSGMGTRAAAGEEGEEAAVVPAAGPEVGEEAGADAAAGLGAEVVPAQAAVAAWFGVGLWVWLMARAPGGAL